MESSAYRYKRERRSLAVISGPVRPGIAAVLTPVCCEQPTARMTAIMEAAVSVRGTFKLDFLSMLILKVWTAEKPFFY